MSKKNDTAARLAGILNAKRGDEPSAAPALSIASGAEPVEGARILPSPALRAPAMPEPLPGNRKRGKSSDKQHYGQCSLYLRKDTRKKVGRALDDADDARDFSELVQDLLEQWLIART